LAAFVASSRDFAAADSAIKDYELESNAEPIVTPGAGKVLWPRK
jgi:hypothetical protein